MQIEMSVSRRSGGWCGRNSNDELCRSARLRRDSTRLRSAAAMAMV
jgi:hypothetical protein